MGSKSEQKAAAEQALLKMEKETGARGLSKAEAEEENSALKTQITDDEKYITQVQQTMDTKKAEWTTRSDLRAGEIAAISQAISILSNDDARDLFKKSITSQGYSFLQTGQDAERDLRRQKAARTLSAAAAGDGRVLSLVAKIGSRAHHFDEVYRAIDSMVEQLKNEENVELKNKEDCEKQRMDDTR